MVVALTTPMHPCTDPLESHRCCPCEIARRSNSFSPTASFAPGVLSVTRESLNISMSIPYGMTLIKVASALCIFSVAICTIRSCDLSNRIKNWASQGWMFICFVTTLACQGSDTVDRWHCGTAYEKLSILALCCPKFSKGQ